MQKILITTGIYPPDIGGPATYAKMLADHLPEARVLTYTTLLRTIPTPLRQMIFWFKVWRASRAVDIVYALSPLGTGVASALVGKPLVVRVVGDRAWEDAVNEGRTRLLLDDFQKLKRRGLKHKLQVWVCKKAYAVVVPSEYLAGIVAGWGIDRNKITLVHNAVKPLVAVSPLNKPLHKEIRGRVILSVGRLVPWKGFRLLIKLMPQFFEINPFFQLVIVGNGPDRKHLAAMVANLNLQHKVFLLGKKSPAEVAGWLAAADLFILNTGYEGFSHAVLEAMAAGVPVITTSVGGNRELVRQGENGFLVKYNDEFNLLEAVKTIVQNPYLRRKFIEEGKKTAAQFTHERTIVETAQALGI